MKRSVISLLLLVSLACPAMATIPGWVQILAHALHNGTFPSNAWMLPGSSPTTTIQVERLRGCEGFIMRLDHPGADNVLVATGIALGAGRPSLYVVANRNQLPWFLRDADKTFPTQVAIIRPSDALPASLTGRAPVPTGPHYDTFIGCQMSGLDADQSRQARAQLSAINAALKRLNSPDNFCEPLRVTSPKQLDTPREALARDLAAVVRCNRCVFYVYDTTPRPSGMWVELGAALAAGRPVTIVTPSVEALPPCLQQPLEGVTVHTYTDHAALRETLQRDPASVLR